MGGGLGPLSGIGLWAFWRTSTTHAGVATGTVLAVLTVAVGWWVDLATSGFLET